MSNFNQLANLRKARGLVGSGLKDEANSSLVSFLAIVSNLSITPQQENNRNGLFANLFNMFNSKNKENKENITNNEIQNQNPSQSRTDKGETPRSRTPEIGSLLTKMNAAKVSSDIQSPNATRNREQSRGDSLR
jgi:hypothetical protein